MLFTARALKFIVCCSKLLLLGISWWTEIKHWGVRTAHWVDRHEWKRLPTHSPCQASDSPRGSTAIFPHLRTAVFGGTTAVRCRTPLPLSDVIRFPICIAYFQLRPDRELWSGFQGRSHQRYRETTTQWSRNAHALCELEKQRLGYRRDDFTSEPPPDTTAPNTLPAESTATPSGFEPSG